MAQVHAHDPLAELRAEFRKPARSYMMAGSGFSLFGKRKSEDAAAEMAAPAPARTARAVPRPEKLKVSFRSALRRSPTAQKA